jgi:tetratricopeptide (TPR) repeat protein
MPAPLALPTFRDVHNALQASQFDWLETTYTGLQNGYENGQLSDEILNDAFEVFGSGFTSIGQGCASWLQEKPDSYVAHVALATWLMNKGFDERGTGSAAAVTLRGWAGLHSLTQQATELLTQSLGLTARPIRSYCLLGRIDWVAGDCRDPHDPPPEWYRGALRCDPRSLVARRIRLQSMQPHWGGSESQMLHFVNHPAQAEHRDHLLHCHHRWMGFYEGTWGENATASDAHFAEAQRIDPTNKWMHLHQARAHYGLDRLDEALASHRLSIEAMPEWAESYEELYNLLPDEEQHLDEALDLIDRGIAAGSLTLMKLRCTLYRDGNYGVTPNPKKVIEFGLQAYEEGCLGSGNIVVTTLYSGGAKVNDPSVIDRKRALEMAEALVAADHPYTHYWMYNRRKDGEYPTMTDVEAAGHLEQAANGGVAPAAYFMAREISRGNVHYERDELREGPAGSVSDLEAQATEWFVRSAQLGDSDAMVRLAYIYVDGNEGTEADWDEALDWATLAEEADNTDAAAAIGYLYGFADDASRHDYALAIASYQRSIEQETSEGDPDKLASRWYSLGYLQQHHNSDIESARSAYTAAADLGHEQAARALAGLAPTGKGLLRRFRK